MTTIKELEEYFIKTHSKHLQEKPYKQWMCMTDEAELDAYKKDATDNPDWEVIVSNECEECVFFGAINRIEKKLILIDYDNISVWFEIHITDVTFQDNIKHLESLKEEQEEEF